MSGRQDGLDEFMDCARMALGHVFLAMKSPKHAGGVMRAADHHVSAAGTALHKLVGVIGR